MKKGTTLFFIAALAFFAIGGDAHAARVKFMPQPYTGADAGHVVLSLAATDLPKSGVFNYALYLANFDTKEVIKLFWQRKRPDALAFGMGLVDITYPSGDPGKPDFTNGEQPGVVFVRALPPGRYGVLNFESWANFYGNIKPFMLKKNFYAPFTIKSGVATYLGEFASYPISLKRYMGHDVKEPHKMVVATYYVVSDQMERDMALAKARVPAITHDEKAIVDPANVKSPFIRAASIPKNDIAVIDAEIPTAPVSEWEHVKNIIFDSMPILDPESLEKLDAEKATAP